MTTFLLPGIVSGTGALTKVGPGTLSLLAANTYTGNTVIDSGTVTLQGSGTALSSPNFIMVVLPGEEEARHLFEELLRRGVVVRPLAAFGLPRSIRISTGADAGNRRCVEAIRDCIATRAAKE